MNNFSRFTYSPSLSMLLVTWNACADLMITLNSLLHHNKILKQLKIQLLIVDGMSSDQSYPKSYQFLKHALFDFAYYRELPYGIYNAMNIALKYSTAPYVLYINSGDVLLDPIPLLHSIKYLNKDNNLLACQSIVAIRHPSWNFCFYESKASGYAHQGLIYRKSLHDSFGLYDEALRVASDILFMRQINPLKICFFDHILVITFASPLNSSRDPFKLLHDYAQCNSLSLRKIIGIVLLGVEKLIHFSLFLWVKQLLNVFVLGKSQIKYLQRNSTF